MHQRLDHPPDAAALALRGDFPLGTTVVSPATRTVRGDGGVVTLEPRVMQVLLALADADGAVVTRAQLAAACWGAQFVGEDAVNRAIGEVRRAARMTGGFVVATIPKIGWHLQPAALAAAPAANPSPLVATMPSRRGLLAGGVALALAGGAAWRFWPGSATGPADELLARGAAALRDNLPASDQQGLGFLREAVTLAPDNATAWGKLAQAWRNVAEYAEPAEVATAVDGAQVAARRAFALDPHQPDAGLALATLASDYGNWLAARQKLVMLLARHPDHVDTNAALALLDMATGRVTASARRIDWVAARDPLSPVFQYRRVYALWATGRLGAMDQTADRAMQLWPSHPAVWFARLSTLGFTGRNAAALAMLDDPAAGRMQSPRFLAVLRTTLHALGGSPPAPAAFAAAIAANTVLAARSPAFSVAAIEHLAVLGDLDAAFAVARGYLLRRGDFVGDLRHAPGEPAINDQFHRKTMMLFVPATAAMRDDRRFLTLCTDMGLVDYWRAAGLRPDFLGG